MSRTLYLFEDGVARGWEPFALTRPVGELLFGALSLRERTEGAVGVGAAGYVGLPELEGFEEEGVPPIQPGQKPFNEERLLLSARYVPPFPETVLDLPDEAPLDGLALTAEDGLVVGWLLPAGHPSPSPEELAGSIAGKRASLELPGSVLQSPWQLMTENTDRLVRDLTGPGGPMKDVAPLSDLPGVHRIGDHAVTAGTDVVIDPSVVLDSRDGPIHLSDGVHVRSFTDLRGPAFIGAGSLLLGGVIEAVTCGPVCKLRGEISASVILGYSNKAHDGYLGHSIVGRWVNLGAFTTNSDLKNNYGSIRVSTAIGERDTGLMKVGVFVGDHAKTGIGTLLSGGTLVGAGANVVGAAVGKRIPAFGWASGNDFVPYRLDAFLDTAERAMNRRGIPLTSGVRELLSRAWRTEHGSPEAEAAAR